MTIVWRDRLGLFRRWCVALAVVPALLAGPSSAESPVRAATGSTSQLEIEEVSLPRGRSILTLALLAGALAGISFGVDSSEAPRWSARNSFDDALRDGLVADSSGGRRAAAITSDVLLAVLGTGLAADWMFEGGEDGRYALKESITTDSSWILGSLLTTQAVKFASARERPYVGECAADSGYHADCGDASGNNTSFFSGHASLSATFAGLLCARALAPIDRSRRDLAVCGGAMAASLTTGLLRVVADEHHATDVLVGWAVGTSFGYVMPRIWDYRGEGGRFSRIAVVPNVGIQRWGMALALEF